MKKEKGITLIALIITIIVMLILVAVTLSITLGENGIIAKTKEAKVKMDRETQRENLISLIEEARDNTGKITLSNIPLARVGATWITGKNDDTAISIPNENGNWMKTKDGEIFFVNSKGTVVDSEGTTPGENTTTGGILDGTYYTYDGTERVVACQVSGNIVTMMGFGESGENVDCNYTIDETNKTVTVHTTDGDLPLTYDIITGNKILIVNQGEGGTSLVSTTEVGFNYTLNGDYMRSDNTRKWSFDSVNHEATLYESYDRGETWNAASSMPVSYFGYNGEYYVRGENISSSNNYQSFVYYENTYTKVID